MLELVIEHLKTVLVEVFRLFLLREKRLSQLPLLLVSCFQVAQFGLLLFNSFLFSCIRVFELLYLNNLHIYRVLQLQCLFLQEQIRITRVVQLLPQQKNLLF